MRAQLICHQSSIGAATKWNAYLGRCSSGSAAASRHRIFACSSGSRPFLLLYLGHGRRGTLDDVPCQPGAPRLRGLAGGDGVGALARHEVHEVVVDVGEAGVLGAAEDVVGGVQAELQSKEGGGGGGGGVGGEWRVDRTLLDISVYCRDSICYSP